MTAWKNKLQKRIFPIAKKLFGFEKHAKILPVDFAKPWWKVITAQKIGFLFVYFSQAVKIAFTTLVPLFIGFVITTGDWLLLLILIGVWLLIQVWDVLAVYVFIVVAANTMYSIHYNAHNFFLNVDPIAHSTRSSGKIIAKISRVVDAYEDYMDILLINIMQVVIGTAAIVVALVGIDLWLGLLAGFSLLMIGVVSILWKFLISASLEKHWIKSEDGLKAASIENLQQVSLIRASFASPEQDKKLIRRNLDMIKTSATVWQTHETMDKLGTQVSYVLSVGIFSYVVISLINANNLDPVLGLSLIATYIAGSSNITFIGGRVRRLLEAHTRIQDFFKFIREFGQQSYPVLPEGSTKSISHEQSSIALENLHFSYDNGQVIFAGHSLDLQQNVEGNNLFGIIGPSGVGKTTFLSIVGGQLKPPEGTVLIDGEDVYAVDDVSRRELLAVQMQTATNLRGELRYNLLFGLPGNEELDSFLDVDPESDDYEEIMELIEAEKVEAEKERIYSDEELVEVLKKVGLWNIFKDKKGLDTLIGEGGLNLSGGQRQRLNFAGLYLRAKHFKPSVILIDEPTSSLDELSEKAVTNMILELSGQALTLVIAHRLKTLEAAQGILDFSLNTKEQNMCFYTLEELQQRSEYYNKLLTGELELDG